MTPLGKSRAAPGKVLQVEEVEEVEEETTVQFGKGGAMHPDSSGLVKGWGPMGLPWHCYRRGCLLNLSIFSPFSCSLVNKIVFVPPEPFTRASLPPFSQCCLEKSLFCKGFCF